MTNFIKDKQVYMAGHILNDAMVDFRDKQHEQVEGIIGVTPYSPSQDKSINDKANAVQEGLAERILKNDLTAIENSDVYVLDLLNEGLGTIAEIGIILGMKKMADKVALILEQKMDDNGGFFETETEDDVYELVANMLGKEVLVYCSDIRQGHGKPYTDPDRAEFSTNQFLYGVVKELTHNKGFISWNEVLKQLEDIGEE